MDELIRRVACESALMSGLGIDDEEDSDFHRLRELSKYVLQCTTGALTHPLILNMRLCGHRDAPRFRSAVRAGESMYMPRGNYVKPLLTTWWEAVEKEVPGLATESLERRDSYAWEQHDFLLCLQPFVDANSRTARLVYYMICKAAGAPIKVIESSKAAAYNAHKREYRENVFAPRLRAQGCIHD